MNSIIPTSLIACAMLALPVVAEAGFCGKGKKSGPYNMRVNTNPYPIQYATWRHHPMYFGAGYYYPMPQTYYAYVPQATYPTQQKTGQTKP